MTCEHCEAGWVEVENLRFECPICMAAAPFPYLVDGTVVDDRRTRAVRVSALAGEVSS